MKKLLLLGLTIVLFMSCQEKGSERWTNVSPEIDVVKAVVKDYEDGNWDAWIAHYSDDAKVQHNEFKLSPKELQEILKQDITNYTEYGFSHEDGEIFYEQIIDDKGDTWVYFWGTWKAKIKMDDKEYVIPVHLACKMVDNKIVEEYGYYNRSSIDATFKEQAIAEEMKLLEEAKEAMKKK